jgi:EmrB/QacA subfamily drug resistance transporter
MAGTFVAAIDNTVVGTAMPTVIGDLGGIDRYGWVFTAYLLVSTATTPVFGRLSDVAGRKRVYMGALIGFVGASMLAGLSQSMDQLIFFRALQGIGAGALIPTGFTMIGDLFEVRERGRVQGFFSSVWASSAIIGPTVGGLITQALSWRWAFYVNLPIGLIALALLIYGFRDRAEPRAGRVDWVGASLFAAAAALLLLGINGEAPLLTFPAAVALGALFVRSQRRSPQPLIAFHLLRIPIIGAGLAIALIGGAVQFGATTYLPPFVQGVLGRTPVEAGLALAAMSVAWPAGSMVTGWYLLRIGVRRAVLAGSLSMAAGGLVLSLVGPDSPIVLIVIGAAATGLGMGCTNTPVLVGAQTAVGYANRGVVTSLQRFSRTLGGAVGVASFGALLNAAVGPRINELTILLDPRTRVTVDPNVIAPARELLASGLHGVFVGLLVISIIGIVLAFQMPEHVLSELDSSRRKPEPSATLDATEKLAPEPAGPIGSG